MSERASETFDLESQLLKFTCTVSRFSDGSVAEIFLQNHKAGSMAGINAQDAAVIFSLALQHGVPFETIRRAAGRPVRSLLRSISWPKTIRSALDDA
jgi:hypothetical protein